MLMVPCGMPASTEQVVEAIALLPDWQQIGDVVDTHVMAGDISIFLARDDFERRQIWHLVPVPGLLQLHFVWPVQPESVAQTDELLAPAGLTASPQTTMTHGHVHHFHSAEQRRGTSLAQLDSRIARLSKAPCEDMRMTAPTARLQLCLKEFPSPAQHDGSLQATGGTPDREASIISRDPHGSNDHLALRPVLGCRIDRLRVDRTPDLEILPAEFREVIDRIFLSIARTMPARAFHTPESRYTIFDAVYQIRVRTHHPEERLEWLLADLLNDTPRPVRTVQLLQDAVEGFPTPQFVLTFHDVPWTHYAVPVDARAMSLGVCTCNFQPTPTWTIISAILQRAAQGSHRCRGISARIQSERRDHRLLMRTAVGPELDPVTTPLTMWQVLRLGIRPPTPPIPADDRTGNDAEAADEDHSAEVDTGTPTATHAVHTTMRAGTHDGSGLAGTIPTPMGRRQLGPCAQSCRKTPPLGTHAPAKLVLDELLPPVLERRLNYGVCEEMWQEFCDMLGTGQLCKTLPDGLKLHKAAAALFDHAVKTPLLDEPRHIVCFTDGAFRDSDKALAWAAVFFAVTETGQFAWMGYKLGRLSTPAAAAWGLSVFPAEVFAFTIATALLASSGASSGTVCFDSTAAEGIAMATHVPQCDNTITKAARACTLLCHFRGCNLSTTHCRSHTGIPGNEFADSLASWAVALPETSTLLPLEAFLQHPEIERLWLIHSPKGMFPTQNGTGISDARPFSPTPCFQAASPAALIGCEARTSVQACEVRLCLATYNTLHSRHAYSNKRSCTSSGEMAGRSSAFRRPELHQSMSASKMVFSFTHPMLLMARTDASCGLTHKPTSHMMRIRPLGLSQTPFRSRPSYQTCLWFLGMHRLCSLPSLWDTGPRAPNRRRTYDSGGTTCNRSSNSCPLVGSLSSCLTPMLTLSSRRGVRQINSHLPIRQRNV